ncbi:hypothetical protein M378DRAFT_173434 [Amanita muscaria Koide BX008]|uniref:Uncharacterized protein n=1 Tax=Amanita muscaria (strain Koide BX008) TaxID=946122 RepID=A0A0C2SNV8_AMAMK|nr:hypothetical protein M378DRAFT_173434 [Amanita muscaria Koide BX008]
MTPFSSSTPTTQRILAAPELDLPILLGLRLSLRISLGSETEPGTRSEHGRERREKKREILAHSSKSSEKLSEAPMYEWSSRCGKDGGSEGIGILKCFPS